jgi:hypothetical protein
MLQLFPNGFFSSHDGFLQLLGLNPTALRKLAPPTASTTNYG